MKPIRLKVQPYSPGDKRILITGHDFDVEVDNDDVPRGAEAFARQLARAWNDREKNTKAQAELQAVSEVLSGGGPVPEQLAEYATELYAELAEVKADRDRLFDAAVVAAELVGTMECSLELQDTPSKTLGVAVVYLADALRAMTTRKWEPNE